MKLRGRKWILSIVLFFFLVALIFAMFYLKSVADYKNAIKDTSFIGINISTISDGSYIGEYDGDFIYAKVKVTVQSGKITDIEILEHKNERGEPAEAIVGQIIREQKINVDAISGATNSSIVIKKAVENALIEEKEKYNSY